MIKIAICDDDINMCFGIENMILEYQNIENINMDISVFNSGEKLISELKKGVLFDLIFLDIELGTTNGIEIGSEIRIGLDDHISKIVFVSSKTGYERKLFDIQPLNFLNKPIDKQKLTNCIKLVVKLLNIEKSCFEYKLGKITKKVQIKDILYFESQLRKIKIVTKNKEEIFYSTIKEISEDLPKTFIIPHRSFLVNYNNIQSIGNDYIKVINGEKISISQGRIKEIRKFQIDFEKERKNDNL